MNYLLAISLVLAHIFSDHAVLQQEADVPVWGWGDPGSKVEVVWDGARYKTTVQADGSWRVTIPTGKADGMARSLKVKSGKECLERTDLVLGEVWLCSGQSNMEMPLSGFGFQEVEGATDAIMAAGETASLLRVFDIKTPKCTEPIKDVEAVWACSTPEVAARTSAVAYFFGKRLTQTLHIPVGIIVNAWGGSRIEPWMTRDAINGAGLTQQELDELYAVEESRTAGRKLPNSSGTAA